MYYLYTSVPKVGTCIQILLNFFKLDKPEEAKNDPDISIQNRKLTSFIAFIRRILISNKDVIYEMEVYKASDIYAEFL